MDIQLFEDDDDFQTGYLHEGDEFKDRSGLFSIGGMGGRSSLSLTLEFGATEPAPRSTRPAMGWASVHDNKGSTYDVPLTTGHAPLTWISRKDSKASVGLRAAEFQLYIERYSPDGGTKAASVMHDSLGALNFGSPEPGADPMERAAFWLALDRFDSKPGCRLQWRFEPELPWELALIDGAARDLLVAFGRAAFVANKIPFWCAGHVPDIENGCDPRNYHPHFVFADRAVERLGEWQWRFDRRKIRTIYGKLYPWGTECPSSRFRRLDAQVKPVRVLTDRWMPKLRQLAQVQRYIQDLDGSGPSWQHRSWPWFLRTTWMRLCNEALRKAARQGVKITRLYDPHSYAERGVEKTPTEHLGRRRTFAERKGYLTTAGMRNRIREQILIKRDKLQHAESMVVLANEIATAAYDLLRSANARAVIARSRPEIASLLKQARIAAADAMEAVAVDYASEFDGLQIFLSYGNDAEDADPNYWRSLQHKNVREGQEPIDLPTEPIIRHRRYGQEYAQAKMAAARKLLEQFDAAIEAWRKEQAERQPISRPASTSAPSQAARDVVPRLLPPIPPALPNQPRTEPVRRPAKLPANLAPDPSGQSSYPTHDPRIGRKEVRPVPPAPPLPGAASASNSRTSSGVDAPKAEPPPQPTSLQVWTYHSPPYDWTRVEIESEIERTGYVLATDRNWAVRTALPSQSLVYRILSEWSSDQLQRLYWSALARENLEGVSDDRHRYIAREIGRQIIEKIAHQKNLRLISAPPPVSSPESSPSVASSRPTHSSRTAAPKTTTTRRRDNQGIG